MRLLILAFFFSSSLLAQPLPEGLTTIEGKAVPASVFNNHKAVVFIFISPECPLCQSYSLTLKQLYSTYKKNGVAFIGIIPGNDFTPAQVKEYQTTYGITFPLYYDYQLKFVHFFQASVTPEVFLINQTGKLLYSGRIDNWAYEVSRKRKVITDHNLRDAIVAFTENKGLKITKTKAIGCFIE